VPRKKKKPEEWTTEEAMRKMFPRKVINEVDREIGKPPSPAKKKSTKGD